MMWATPKLMSPPRRNQQEQEDPWQVHANHQRMWNSHGEARGEDFEVDMASLEAGSLYSWVDEGMEDEL